MTAPTLASLSLKEIKSRLRRSRLALDIPPYRPIIGCREPGFAEALLAMYHDYPLTEAQGFHEVSLEMLHWGSVWRFGRRQLRLGVNGNFPFNPLPLGQAYPMFEWGLNWCITNYLHERITFHSAGLGYVDAENRPAAIMLPGVPGAGKSTLTAAALERRFTLLSDELCLLSPELGTLLPIPRPISLKDASIELIGARQPDARMTSPVRDTTKGTVAHLQPPPPTAIDNLVEPVARLLVFPRYQRGARLACQPLPTGQAMLRLADQSFNLHLHGETGFIALVRLMEGVRTFELEYSDLDSALDCLERLAAEAPLQ